MIRVPAILLAYTLVSACALPSSPRGVETDGKVLWDFPDAKETSIFRGRQINLLGNAGFNARFLRCPPETFDYEIWGIRGELENRFYKPSCPGRDYGEIECVEIRPMYETAVFYVACRLDDGTFARSWERKFYDSEEVQSAQVEDK